MYAWTLAIHPPTLTRLADGFGLVGLALPAFHWTAGFTPVGWFPRFPCGN